MATSLLSVLESLREKIAAMAANVEKLRENNTSLQMENDELRRQLRQALKERDEARLESEFLAVSHKLADDPDKIIDARRLIAGMIRNIDRCIEMLKE